MLKHLPLLEQEQRICSFLSAILHIFHVKNLKVPTKKDIESISLVQFLADIHLVAGEFLGVPNMHVKKQLKQINCKWKCSLRLYL